MEEVRAALGADAAPFESAYGLSPTGNWEPEDGSRTTSNILFRSGESVGDIATALNLDEAAVAAALRRGIERLRRLRAGRAKPHFDDKVLADWNGLAIAALAEAGAALNEADWVLAAEAAFSFVTTRLVDGEDRLRHAWRAEGKGGRVMADALIDDYAALMRAALTLYEVTGRQRYLQSALRLEAEATDGYWDDAALGYFHASASAGSVVRMRAGPDGETPSGNGIMAEVLARLYYLTGNREYSERAEHAVQAFGAAAAAADHFNFATLMNSYETLARAVQVVVVGRRGDQATDALLRTVWETSLPTRVLQVIAPGTVLPEGHPARYKDQVGGLATVYVCVGPVCSLPVTDTVEFSNLLKDMRADSRN